MVVDELMTVAVTSNLLLPHPTPVQPRGNRKKRIRIRIMRGEEVAAEKMISGAIFDDYLPSCRRGV
jgi:hypothetical protein